MPRPKIEGTLVRQIDMNHRNPAKGSDKDYRITVSQRADGLFNVYTEHGPAGKLQNGKAVSEGLGESAAHFKADEIRDGKINQSDSYKVTNDRSYAKAAPAAAPAAPAAPKAAPRPLITSEQLSPASRAALATIF